MRWLNFRYAKRRLAFWRAPGLALVLLLLAVGAPARTLHVGAGQPYPRLRVALARAAEGDTVLVHPGVYQEGNLVLNRRVVLRGLGWPVLDGRHRDELLTVKAHGFELSGFVLRRSGQGSMIDYAGVKVYDSRDVYIHHNRLQDCFFGIYLSGCARGRVEYNTLQGDPDHQTQNESGNGIHLWRCAQMHIRNNRISGHRDGIYFEFVTDSHIERNLSENNLRYGLHFMFSHDNTYQRNTFRDNGAGVAVMYSHGVRMQRNAFIDNRGASSYGLLLKDISDSYISDNTFEGNTVGVQLESASRCILRRNRVERNGWGMRLTASCDQNYLTGNAFIGNTFDLATNGTVMLNVLRGNFWDKYRGYDLDGDEVGDVPYHPLSAFSYAVEQLPAAIIFFRSPMVEVLDRTEKLVPSLTPAALVDLRPRIRL
ncbi:right-handed parallel beta-helix repeat-containing protein [Hymenobacter humi]